MTISSEMRVIFIVTFLSALPFLTCVKEFFLPNPLKGLSMSLKNVSFVRKSTDKSSGEETLRFVFVITRHGSRSPLSTYPKDPYPYTSLEYWPDGVGQLTKFGKQQLYASGQTYRKRYNKLLSVLYSANDTLVKTNLYDRDFMSASTFLAGLYPPISFQLWNPFLIWQPIPIWEEPFDSSKFMDSPDLCPKFTREQVMAVYKLNRESKKYEDLLRYLTKYSGQKVTKITDVLTFWDCFTMQFENGYKLPLWSKSVYPEKLAPLQAIAFATLAAGTSEMARLAGGPVLANITDELVKKSRGELLQDRKLMVLAAHDSTIAVVLRCLGFHEAFVIDTSASMAFELLKTSEGHAVQIAYFNNSGVIVPHFLKIPSCSNPCPLKKFVALVRSVTPKNLAIECQD